MARVKSNGSLTNPQASWQEFLAACNSERAWGSHANFKMNLDADTKYLGKIRENRPHVKEIAVEDPLARRAIEYQVQMAVGTSLRVKPTPMSRHLGWTAEETCKFSDQFKDAIKLYLESDERWLDSQGLHTLTEKVAQHTRIFKSEGEAFELVQDLPEERRSPLSFAMANLDPSRVAQPTNIDNLDNRIRDGVLLSRNGYHLGYYVHDNARDNPVAIGRNGFRFVPTRNSDTGRQQIIHTYVQATSDLSRGISRLASCLCLSSQREKYVDAVLEDAIAKAGVTFVVTSNSQSAGDIVDLLKTNQPGASRNESSDPLRKYMEKSAVHHKAMGTSIRGSKVVRLLHGEQLDGFSAQQAGDGTFEQFSNTLDLLASSCHDMPLEEYQQQWHRTNYSGARSGKLYLWNMINQLRAQAPWRTTRQILSLALESFILNGQVQLPGFEGRPFDGWQFFIANKAAICCVELFGSPKDEIDRAKTADAYLAEGQLGVATWESYCNEVLGRDWEEVMQQVIVEVQKTYEFIQKSTGAPPTWTVSDMATHRLFGGNAFLGRKNLRDLGAITELETDQIGSGTDAGDGQIGRPAGS